jgi:hypothetical protein
MRAKIVKCDNPRSWYYGREGEEYRVFPCFDLDSWYTDREPEYGQDGDAKFVRMFMLRKEDCELIPELNEDER